MKKINQQEIINTCTDEISILENILKELRVIDSLKSFAVEELSEEDGKKLENAKENIFCSLLEINIAELEANISAKKNFVERYTHLSSISIENDSKVLSDFKNIDTYLKKAKFYLSLQIVKRTKNDRILKELINTNLVFLSDNDKIEFLAKLKVQLEICKNLIR